MGQAPRGNQNDQSSVRNTEFDRYSNRLHESGAKKLALGPQWEILGVSCWVTGSEIHIKYKSNTDSPQKSQEEESHSWGHLFPGSKVKWQDIVPKRIGGQGRTLMQGLASASEGLSTRKITKAGT